MDIRTATVQDLPMLEAVDRHVSAHALAAAVAAGRVLVAVAKGSLAGWLRWGLLWDEIPFMHLLFVLEEQRGHGVGTALVAVWERDAAAAGHRSVLTSTQADETAQHLYRALGYEDCGALVLPGQAAELVLRKELPVSSPAA